MSNNKDTSSAFQQIKSAAGLRRLFLDFFMGHGHQEVASSSLIPVGDATLMFSNAGMVQFKEVFAGTESRAYQRATTAQRCLRVSGKHNDLEEVGRTARHHTFFEMLGNFSFGDYGKQQAIEMAWDFLTQQVGLDPNRLWVTVFGGASDGVDAKNNMPADTEARAIWRQVAGLADHRIIDMGVKDNFWAMGATGPCGPCTEIHYDQRQDCSVIPQHAEFEDGSLVEIWNVVFMQFIRDSEGHLNPLPKLSVDTGMGLERLAAIAAGESSNYHTDLFLPIIEGVALGCQKTYHRGDSDDDISLRVIADHARATTFLIADGISPSNEGRGYVMRRIMRRAIRHGRRLGFTDLFFHDACAAVISILGDAYPEVKAVAPLVKKLVQLEETAFRRTLDRGLVRIDELITETATAVVQNGESREISKQLSGERVFELYDTYGFPLDLTEVIAAEHGYTVDQVGFDKAMLVQRERSRQASTVGEGSIDCYGAIKSRLGKSNFVGYKHASKNSDDYCKIECRVVALMQNGVEVESIAVGKSPAVLQLVLDPTPFYGESGGQVGDKGVVTADGLHIDVTDTQKPLDDFFVSDGELTVGTITLGQTVRAGYRVGERAQIRAHHSATHLLHRALQEKLADHVQQKGSLVDSAHLRFDYTHFESPTRIQLRMVEDEVNRLIALDNTTETEELPFEEAKKSGAMALFGEKYGDTVRVVKIGDSVEFCGGTHVKNSTDIGLFLITKEEAVATGVRRMEAVVGDAALIAVHRWHGLLCEAVAILSGEGTGTSEKTTDSILQAAKKTKSNHQRLSALLNKSGAAVDDVASCKVLPPLREPVRHSEAARMRDLWGGLVQLTNCRVAEAETIAKQYKLIDHEGVLGSFAALHAGNRALEKQLKKVASGNLGELVESLCEKVEEHGGIKVLAATVKQIDGKQIRELAERLQDKISEGVVCLCADNSSEAGKKVVLLVAISKGLCKQLPAGKMIGELAPLVGGRGGGKPQLAQAGGDKPEGIDAVLSKVKALVGGLL